MTIKVKRQSNLEIETWHTINKRHRQLSAISQYIDSSNQCVVCHLAIRTLLTLFRGEV